MSQDPLALAAQTLSAICDAVDESPNIDEVLTRTFNDAQLQLEAEVDKRIAFDMWSKNQLDAAKEGYRYFRERAASLEEVRTRFKERMTQAMLANPNLPFRGRLGKVSCVENPKGVDYTFGDRTLDESVIDFFAIPAEYVKTKISYEIDHQKVKADLAAGKELGWAKPAAPKHHVRFPAARKPKAIEGKTDGTSTSNDD